MSGFLSGASVGFGCAADGTFDALDVVVFTSVLHVHSHPPRHANQPGGADASRRNVGDRVFVFIPIVLEICCI